MLNKLSNKLAMRLVNNHIICKEEFDKYVYGFELILSFFFSTFMILGIGLISRCIVKSITFLIVFISLRSFTGGYHALTYSYCTFVTLLVYISSMLLSYYLPINEAAFFILFVVGSIVLFVFTPVKNPNKKVSPKKTEQYKITSLLLFYIFYFVGLYTNKVIPGIGNTVFYTLCADIILIFPKNLKVKRKETQ